MADGEGIRPELTLEMAERRLTESPPDEESWVRGQWFGSSGRPKVTLSPSLAVSCPDSSDVKQRPTKLCSKIPTRVA